MAWWCRVGLLLVVVAAQQVSPPFLEVEEIPAWEFDSVNARKRQDHGLKEDLRNASLPLITVVTRSGFRPRCLANLQASLAAQRGVDFLQIISNDAGPAGRAALELHVPRAKHTMKIVDLDRSDFLGRHSSNKCYSTKYLRKLYSLAPADSWIVTLDDDARLVDADQLRRIQVAASFADPKSHLLLQDAFLGKNDIVVYPNYTDVYENGHVPKIDTANTIFHQSATSRLAFSTLRCGGDKQLFLQLIRDYNYTLAHVTSGASFLSASSEGPETSSEKEEVSLSEGGGGNPGVWANYDGQAKQDISLCDVAHLAPGEATFLASKAYQVARLEPTPDLEAQAAQHYVRLLLWKSKATQLIPPENMTVMAPEVVAHVAALASQQQRFKKKPNHRRHNSRRQQQDIIKHEKQHTEEKE